jgi:hypothetical protein
MAPGHRATSTIDGGPSAGDHLPIDASSPLLVAQPDTTSHDRQGSITSLPSRTPVLATVDAS